MTISLRKVLLLSVSCVAIGMSTWWLFQPSENSTEEKTIVAKTNSFDITLSDAEATAGFLGKNPNPIEFLKLDNSSQSKVINEIVVNEIASQKAINLNLDQEIDVDAYVEAYRKQLLKLLYVQNVVRNQVTEEAIKKEYESLKNTLNGKSGTYTRHILVNTKEEANKIKKELKKKSFEVLAKEYSQDAKSAQQGGGLGYLIEGEMDKAFEKATKDLKIGAVSSPFQTDQGWHIVRVDDRKKLSVQPLEKVKTALAKELSTKVIQQELQKILADAQIEVLLKSIESTP